MHRPLVLIRLFEKKKDIVERTKLQLAEPIRVQEKKSNTATAR